jgi:uncharacterized protein YbjT (DUF2867 family)
MNSRLPVIDTPGSLRRLDAVQSTGRDDTMTTNGTVLVLGGTGKTGRRIVERLQARGIAVRVGSRSASPPFEWEDPATWGPALAGVSGVYVSYYPDLAVPGAPEAVGALAEEARRQGVQRLVLLSGRGEEEAQRAEQVVQGAGLEWTVVRCSWFNQNFSEDYLLEPILEGEVALPAGDTPEPFVDTEDIADVAVAALTEPGHSGRVYELTGPRLLTFAEAIAEIGRGTGRELRSVPISVEEYAAGAAEHGLPEDVIGLVQYLFSEVLDGRNAQLADGVQQALGREPRDFADYVRETAATGVWNP